MDKTIKKSLRGLDKYSRDVWEPFLRDEFSNIRNKKVLDLGCGMRRYTKDLVNNNRLIGVDINKNSEADIIAFAEDLPFDDNYFDEIIAIGLLDYTDPKKTAIEMNRVLKRDGIIRILVPNILNPYVKVATTFGPSRNKKSGFVVKQIANIFHKTGFDIINIVSMGFCFWVPFKRLQEVFIPLFKDVDWVTNGKYGNNIYLVGRKL